MAVTQRLIIDIPEGTLDTERMQLDLPHQLAEELYLDLGAALGHERPVGPSTAQVMRGVLESFMADQASDQLYEADFDQGRAVSADEYLARQQALADPTVDVKVEDIADQLQETTQLTAEQALARAQIMAEVQAEVQEQARPRGAAIGSGRLR